MLDLRYFDESEFTDMSKLDIGLLRSIDDYRHLCGKPFIVHSDYREGDGSSQHHLGKAIDGHVKGLNLVDQYFLAERSGLFKGIGLYPCWNSPGLHLDVRDGLPARWICYSDVNGQHYVPLTYKNLKRYIIH